jgi:hypothetical protein
LQKGKQEDAHRDRKQIGYKVDKKKQLCSWLSAIILWFLVIFCR